MGALFAKQDKAELFRGSTSGWVRPAKSPQRIEKYNLRALRISQAARKGDKKSKKYLIKSGSFQKNNLGDPSLKSYRITRSIGREQYLRKNSPRKYFYKS